jgi:hypothetical protein
VLEGKSLSEQVQSIRGKQVEVRVQLKGMRNLYQSYEKLLNENNPQGLLMTQGQAYGGILGQIQKIDSDLSMKLAQYREDSLPILALRKSREELMLTATRQAKEVVMGNLETQIKEIEARDREMTAWQKNLNQTAGTASSYSEFVGLLGKTRSLAARCGSAASTLDADRSSGNSPRQPRQVL